MDEDADSDSDVVEVLSKASASAPRRNAPPRAATTKCVCGVQAGHWVSVLCVHGSACVGRCVRAVVLLHTYPTVPPALAHTVSTGRRKATKYVDDEVEEEDESDESLSEPGDSVSGVFEEEEEDSDDDDFGGGGGGRGKGKGKGKKGAAASAATKKRKPAAAPASAAAKRKPAAAAASSSVSSRALPPWMTKPQVGGASQGGKGRARSGAATATAPRAASSGTNEEVDFDLEALSRNA